LVHDVDPTVLYRPLAHCAPAGVGDVEPGGHAYPALQLEHDVAPDKLYIPNGQMSDGGVDDCAAAAHA
jgi:hypothetical protein